MAKTGSTVLNMKPRQSSNSSKAASKVITREVPSRGLMVLKGMISLISFNLCLAGPGRRGGRQAAYKGKDFNAELHLNLKDIAETHKQTLTVNGKNIRITIPAGVENGQTIKIAGHGSPGANSGPAGDLYIKFRIAEDASFKRDGSDLYQTVKLNLYTAVLGGEITMDTLSGKVKIKVKPETQNGAKVKLKGKGPACL